MASSPRCWPIVGEKESPHPPLRGTFPRKGGREAAYDHGRRHRRPLSSALPTGSAPRRRDSRHPAHRAAAGSCRGRHDALGRSTRGDRAGRGAAGRPGRGTGFRRCPGPRPGGCAATPGAGDHRRATLDRGPPDPALEGHRALRPRRGVPAGRSGRGLETMARDPSSTPRLRRAPARRPFALPAPSPREARGDPLAVELVISRRRDPRQGDVLRPPDRRGGCPTAGGPGPHAGPLGRLPRAPERAAISARVRSSGRTSARGRR
jgi:hypothetical protein